LQIALKVRVRKASCHSCLLSVLYKTVNLMDNSYRLQCQGESEVSPKLNSYDPLSVCMQCEYSIWVTGVNFIMGTSS
jgi:hypothetical protein